MAATKNYYIEELTTEAVCGDLFDHIDDLLDFPGDEFLAMQSGAMETPYNPGGGFVLPTTSAPLHNADQELPVGGDAVKNSSTINNAADTSEFERGGGKMLFEELDIADLEWVSNFIDDSANSFTAFDYLPKSSSNNETESTFRTPSPISVLLPNSHAGSTSSSSSSSYSGGDSVNNSGRTILPNTVPARARTKRRRPAAFSSRPQVITIHPFLDDSESFGQLAEKKAKLGTAMATTTCGEAATVRKCTHCEIQKTPQWRAGPMGPKTLCNACGVRYKSGRLFPEYRPAASPTFVAALHSNSHKRVVEMRINGGDGQASGCDLLEYIRRKE